jgi:hypothetical protein
MDIEMTSPNFDDLLNSGRLFEYGEGGRARSILIKTVTGEKKIMPQYH